MKRVLWLGLGAAIGALAYQKLRTTAALASPQGLNRTANRIADNIAAFAENVREGMNEREGELRRGLGLDD